MVKIIEVTWPLLENGKVKDEKMLKLAFSFNTKVRSEGDKSNAGAPWSKSDGGWPPKNDMDYIHFYY